MQDCALAERRFAGSFMSPQADQRFLRTLDKPMDVTNVCHLVWKLRFGGLERQMIELLGRLPKQRFHHVVVVRGWDEHSEKMCKRLGENVDVIRQSGPSRDGAWSHRLAAILREYDVDVLHVRGMSMLVDSVMAAELYGETSVGFSFHGFESHSEPFKGIRRKIFRESILRCKGRWAVSDSAAAAITQQLNLPCDTFGVIPNGVDIDRFHPIADRAAVRKTLGLPPTKLVVLSVGNLKPIKGHEIMLQAARRLGADAGAVTWVLIGQDYLDGKLQRWAADYLPNVDVRFGGERTDVRSWYQAADLFIQPSLWEGMSNALLEAMSCGLPVVATRVGGNSDVIEDGRSGLLVEAGDAAALDAALRRLIGDDALRGQLKRAARQRVRNHFSMDKAMADYTLQYGRLAHPDEPEAVELAASKAVMASDPPGETPVTLA